MALFLFGFYAFLAAYNAGNMTSLQLQHYGIYPFVGPENFKGYMQANNRAALLPAVIPGMLMLLLSVVLLFIRPAFMTRPMALASVALNVIAFASTVKWQRRIQAEMAATGYDEAKIALLRQSNWVRTIAFLLLAVFTILLLVLAVK